MTRQRYNITESLNRILRILENKPLPTDAPETVTGELTSWNDALSDIAELLASSLPGESAVLPPSISVPVTNIPTGSFSSPTHTHTQYVINFYDDSVYKGTGTSVRYNSNLDVQVTGTSMFVDVSSNPSFTTEKIGTSPNYAYFGADGTFRLTGSATAFEDLRVDGLNTRAGVVAPTDETGFRGNSAFQVRNFVHNQADEVQFDVQFPHAWNAGSTISPHVHFSPWITGTASVQAVRFILDFYWGNIDEPFPTGSSTFAMEYTWTGSFQWKHLIAEHVGTDLSGAGKGFSSIMKCRLYRDNTITNNLAGKATLLYFDIHYEVDAFGSSQEYVK